MADKVLLDAEWVDHPVAEVLGSFSAVERIVTSHPGFMDRSTSKCYRMPVAGVSLFIKYYQRVSEKEGLRLRHFGRSRPMREWRNLALFRRLGIATTPPVAVGERHQHGVFRAGFIATLEVEGAQELGALAAESPQRVRAPAFFYPLCTALAGAVRALHAESFFHNDLNDRNVLVREAGRLEVFLFDSPNGRRWYFPLREFRLIKDLTTLDSGAREVFSRTQRLRFYLAYAYGARALDSASSRPALSRRDKRRLRRIVARSARPRKPLDPNVKSYIE